MINKIAILLFITHSWFPDASGQGNLISCLEKVRDYNRKLNKMDFPVNDEVYYMSYESKTIMRDENTDMPPVNMSVQVLLGKEQLDYISRDIEVYQDNRDAFMIIHSKKLVLWATSSIREDKEQKLKQVISLQDTLFGLCSVTGCDKIKAKDGKELLKVVLKPNEAAKKAFKISGMEYLYDDLNHKVEQVTTDFIDSYEVKQISIKYKEINFNYKARLAKQVINKVLNKNNQLLPKYKGYTLVDNR